MNKSREARKLYAEGMRPAAIAKRLGVKTEYVNKAIKRNDYRDRSKGEHKHTMYAKWSGRPTVPKGRCLKWITAKGDYCGATCKGQRCAAHKEAQPAFNTLSTKFRGAA